MNLIMFILMFVLGIGYYHGLKWFFRYNFRWSYAAVVGILITVCLTASFIWIPRYGYEMAIEIIISLVFPFSGALYWMIRFDMLLRQDKAENKKTWMKIIEAKDRLIN